MSFASSGLTLHPYSSPSIHPSINECSCAWLSSSVGNPPSLNLYILPIQPLISRDILTRPSSIKFKADDKKVLSSSQTTVNTHVRNTSVQSAPAGERQKEAYRHTAHLPGEVSEYTLTPATTLTPTTTNHPPRYRTPVFPPPTQSARTSCVTAAAAAVVAHRYPDR